MYRSILGNTNTSTYAYKQPHTYLHRIPHLLPPPALHPELLPQRLRTSPAVIDVGIMFFFFFFFFFFFVVFVIVRGLLT